MSAPDTERAAPRRPVLVVAALVALAVAAVVVLVAAAHVTPVGHGHPGSSGGAGGLRVPTIAPQPTAPSQPPQHHRTPSVVPFAILILIGGLAATVAGIAILLALLRAALRRRALPRLRFEAGEEMAAPGVIVADQVGSAVDRALSELGAGGPVDDAIIRCWVALESAADEAGLPRQASDTPEEAVGRLLAAGGVRADPLHALAELYREARFSRHPMSAASAAAARDALTGIVEDLRARRLASAEAADRAG